MSGRRRGYLRWPAAHLLLSRGAYWEHTPPAAVVAPHKRRPADGRAPWFRTPPRSLPGTSPAGTRGSAQPAPIGSSESSPGAVGVVEPVGGEVRRSRASVLCGGGLFDQIQQFGLAGDAERADEHLAVGRVRLAMAEELHSEHIAVTCGVHDEAMPGEDPLGLQRNVDPLEVWRRR